MSSPAPTYRNPEFDQYAEDYDAALAQGLSVSGESKDFFAAGRGSWLALCLASLQLPAGDVLDFGCGTGSATPYLLRLPGARAVVGVEVSAESLKVAQKLHGAVNVHFRLVGEFLPEQRQDLAFCNGVFHHIPLAERAGAIRYVHDCLRPGGLFAFWENNPWNPGTRYVMSRIPFDRDAVTLSCLEARRLLKAGGFEVLRTDFQFVFPRALKAFRPLERLVVRLPLGAQYQVLARKPL